MRTELFYNPRLLCERLAEISLERRRRRILRRTPAQDLKGAFLDSLELLQLRRNDPPKVIYDIGGYIGTWSLLAKSVFPESAIHAFEPIPELNERFRETVKELRDVTCHQVALGKASMDAAMYLGSHLDASSLLPMTEKMTRDFAARPAGTTQVRVEPLDGYRQRLCLPKPDLIKLDVQGFELEVLRGAAECLAHAQAVIAEVSFGELYKGQCLFEELVGFLASQNYRVRAFGAATRLGERFLQTDVLFERVC